MLAGHHSMELILCNKTTQEKTAPSTMTGGAWDAASATGSRERWNKH